MLHLYRLALPLVSVMIAGASPAASQQTDTTFTVDPLAGTVRIVMQIGRQPTLDIPTVTLFHTLARDFFRQDDGTMYVQTGDIPAMWLRDSSAQTIPYVRFIPAVTRLGSLIRAVIERNAKNVLKNPRANAFTVGYQIWEEKWEVDSLAYPVTLAWTYWKQTHDRRVFTRKLHWALAHTVSTFACEQQHRRCSQYTSRFLDNHGRGADYADTGMIWSAFRPSDDPVRYPFNIPQQMLAEVALRELAELAVTGYGDLDLAAKARALAGQVRAGIDRNGVVYDFRYGWLYAYEVDGRGNVELMDDANVPNLVSAPYLGYVSKEDPVYNNTRRFALSSDNPYYYRGRYAEGLGSPHTRTGWVWPLGIIARGLTAPTPKEVSDTIGQVHLSNPTDELIHESFDPNDPSQFTRTEFGWGNAMFAELIFRSATVLPLNPLPPLEEISILPLERRTPRVVDDAQALLNAYAIQATLLRLLQE
ncbi:MAG TPA: glycoside hydrolase family 125 protein [Candidatus Tumulicola sp.]|nr:glycoside hydrolase family 125 protein [Candidatus Tumulicola sp.]